MYNNTIFSEKVNELPSRKLFFKAHSYLLLINVNYMVKIHLRHRFFPLQSMMRAVDFR